MKRALVVACLLAACAASQPVRLVGEYGKQAGRYVFRDCATGAELDVTMRSEALYTYLTKAQELNAQTSEMLVVEVDALPLGTYSGEQHYGIGRVHNVRRGGCSAV